MMFDLSIVIVNTNTQALTCQCIQSIYDNVQIRSFEVIVVDNASTDGSCEAIRARFPSVRLIQNDQNLGFSAANNRGFAVARGRHIMLLNNDTIVLPGSIDALLAALEADRSVGVVAPKLIYPDGTLQMSFGPIPDTFVAFCTFFDVKRLFSHSARQRLSQSRLAGLVGRGARGYLAWSTGQAPRTTMVDSHTYVTGACMLIRRECLDQVGGLDPGFFMYVDDADYSLRVHQAGWRILYLAEATIVHIKGGTVGERYRWTCAPAYQSMLYFMNKHRGRWVFRLSKIFAVVAVFGRWLASVAMRPSDRRNAWMLLTAVASYRAPV